VCYVFYLSGDRQMGSKASPPKSDHSQETSHESQ